jgi:glutamyl-tRNA synthetase
MIADPSCSILADYRAIDVFTQPHRPQPFGAYHLKNFPFCRSCFRRITMSITVRFAPSPTGFIHIGNARVALWNWLLAKKAGGKFILRLDDTDLERSTQEFADAIKEDLAWLGITPDQFERQSDRVTRYATELDRLKAAGLVYPCYETAEELDRKRKRQQGRGVPPVYDRAALKLTADERAAFESEGRKPHWRFKLSGQSAEWEDGVRGHARIETSSLSDPVLVRGDGTVLYTFASVVDDVDMAVTDIIRGEDHVANTGVQIELFRALGAIPPRFAHHNLIIAASGEEMSKRKGTLSIRSFREAGAEAAAVAAVAVLTGTSEAVRPIQHLNDLIETVELSKFSRAPTKFDPAEVLTLSGRILHEMPYSAVADRLGFLDLPADKAEALWNAVHTNLTTLASISEWKALIFEPVTGRIEEPDYIKQAIETLPSGPWPTGNAGEAIWGEWTDALKALTGRKGKPLFMPLRQALTGQDHGPELKLVLPLLGRERVLSRLHGQSA